MLHTAAPRVLFVDDESINQHIAAEILQTLGAIVDTADHGLRALHLIRKEPYALVFTDVEMPVMDGITLTHILRQDSRYEKLPLVACTAVSSREEEDALLAKGFTAVIRKPFDAESLHEALNKYAASDKGETPSVPPAPLPLLSGKAVGEDMLQLHGFSIREGLARVMGNFPLYISLLFDFRRELAAAAADIRHFREREDMPAILAAVHKLKGISGNVGATDLYARIVDIEPRLRIETPETGANVLDTLERDVTNTLSELAAAEKALAAADMVSPAVPAPQGAPDVPKLRAALTETLELVRQYNTAAQESFEAARAFLGSQGAADAADIQHAIESFDFDKAQSGILHLARSLELELGEEHVLP